MLSMNELKLMQNYPLWMKIEKSKKRIQEWYENYDGQVYISFSGGKDSTALLYLVRSMYPDVEAVFSNTGLEFPEIIKFVKNHNNVTIIKPEKTFKEVIETEGYPVISKSVSNCVKYARKNIAEGKDTLRLRQITGLEKGSKFNKGKWEYLLNAPFPISDKCCYELKKKPFRIWQKENRKYPIIGVMAAEGGVRREAYLKTGCNAFNSKTPISKPFGFWTEQDILKFLTINNIEICSVYGEIKNNDGIYYTTKESRVGCIWCPLGAHREKEPNRYQRLKESHPNLYNYCIYKLGLAEVLDYIGIKY